MVALSFVVLVLLLTSTASTITWNHIQTEKPSEGQDVPYYHFPMLNDKARNDAYYEGLKSAFAKTQRQGKKDITVVDLGAGFMLLSMMAVELGAQTVYAIERNSLVADVGRQILHRNRMTKKVHVVEEDSLYITSDDIPIVPDILVSETLDSWIIGEGFLSSLNDLKLRGYVNRDTIIVPSRGKLFMQLVQSQYSLPANHSVHHFQFDPLLTLKPFTNMVLREHNVQVNLSEPVDAFDFDFQGYFPSDDPHDHILYPYPNGIFDIRRFAIPITATGAIHGAVFWFDVGMDEEATTHLSNAPSSSTHWRPMLCLFGEDYYVTKGSTVYMEVSRLSERFTFAFDRIATTTAAAASGEDAPAATLTLANRDRHIMVYQQCDSTTPYEIFVTRYPEQIYPVAEDFVIAHHSAAEFNVLIAPVGAVIRAINRETGHVQSYVVDDDAPEMEDYVSSFAQLPIFYVGACKEEGDVSDATERWMSLETSVDL
eukprot:gene29970-36197_t